MESNPVLVDKASCRLADPVVDAVPPIIEEGRCGRGGRASLTSGTVTHCMAHQAAGKWRRLISGLAHDVEPYYAYRRNRQAVVSRNEQKDQRINSY